MRVQFHETLVNLAAHPLVWGMARLARRVGPVWKVPGLGVLISDAECAREILRRDDEFTKNGPGSFAQGMTVGLGPMALSNMDGAEHRQLRAAIADLLTPARADVLLDNRADDVALMCSRLSRGECVDLVHFVRGWSGRLAFELLGIAPPVGREEEASQEIVRLSERMASMLGFSRPSKRQIRIAQADREQIAAYFRDGYEQPAPAMSLSGRMQTLGFTFEQAISLLVMFVMAGTLTTGAALPRIVALLADSGSFGQLAANPALIPQATDEGLRYVTPLPGTVRVVKHDTEVQGHKLAADSRLVILTCNLARDAKLFTDPDRFDITRSHNPRAKRSWYGAGPHRCAGLNLAQRQLHAALSAMISAVPNVRIVKRRVAFGALLPAYAHLVVQAVDR